MGFEGQLSDADRACMHERDERSDEETAAELLEKAVDAQHSAQLRFDHLKWRSSYDDYEHNLIRHQELSARSYARARALYDIAAAEVAP